MASPFALLYRFEFGQDLQSHADMKLSITFILFPFLNLQSQSKAIAGTHYLLEICLLRILFVKNILF
jgi:hypothetical protein